MVWCIICERVWRAADLAGASPNLACPDPCCDGGRTGSFLPYDEVRRLVVVRWPKAPLSGQHCALRS